MGHVSLAHLALALTTPLCAHQPPHRDDAGANMAASWRQQWRSDRNARIDADPKIPYVPTSILVKFSEGSASDPHRREALKARAGVRIEPIETWSLTPHLEHVLVEGDFDVALRTLRASPIVDFAEPDYVGSLAVVPNDQSFPQQWGLRNAGQTVNGDRGIINIDIDAELAWNNITGNESFVVAIVDSGIRRTHADLAQNIWLNPHEVPGDAIDNDGDGRIDDTWGWDFWNDDKDPSDDYGHGTHVAGIVGARGNNGVGIAGVCWQVRLAALKIAGRQGNFTISNSVSALDYCAAKRIRLSNHSYRFNESSDALAYSVAAAAFHRHLLVCAAGNGGHDNLGDNNDLFPNYPANLPYDNVISVLAVDNDGLRTRFSNYGIQSVDIGAPGMNILSTWHTSNTAYRFMNGTSMATPHVTGACALVWMRNPSWNYRDVRSRVLSTARPLPNLNGRCSSGGMLNVHNAVE